MKRVVLLLCATIVALSSSNGQTNVSGTITKDSVWTLAKSPYIVTGNLTVNSPFTLTVDSGVVVRFQSNTWLYVRGSIAARHAKFTSAKDTALGAPAKGDWNGIQIGDPSYTGTAIFDTCTFKYGGSQYANSDYAIIHSYKGTTTLSGCDVSMSKNHGVGVLGGATLNLVQCNLFSNNWPAGFFGQGSLVFSGVNNLTGNTSDGINVSFSSSSGTWVLDTASVPYVFPSFNVNGTMVVASGNILKFRQYAELNIYGSIQAISAPSTSIIFTSFNDDNAGGDTNADGFATQPAANYWYGVTFRNESIDSANVMRRCLVRFAGAGNTGGITMYNASPTIDSCVMSNNYYGVMMQGVSNPVFTNNDIGTSSMVPIALSFSANPVFSGNTFSAADNQFDAIGILSETIVASSYLPIRSVTNIPNVTYLLLGTVTVPSSYSLTIQPGVVIKSYNYYNRLVIQGKLTAEGKADSTIVFTSVHDDQYGNPKDTNKNGNLTNPGRTDWGGITFEASSDTSSIIKYAVLRYGNTPSVYYNGVYTEGIITLINASPKIQNDTLTDHVYGIYAFQASNPLISGCTFINSQYTPIAMSVSANPTFVGNSYQNPGLRALGLIGEQVGVNGTVKRRTFAGVVNITYVVLGDITISSGTTVSVEPGVVIKFRPYTGIYVNGGFTAKGDMANGVITFTSIKDDNIGNPLDTNGDGLATSPQRGDWYAIRFLDTSVDTLCVLDSVKVQYAGASQYGNVNFVNASGTVRNSVLSDGSTYGLRCDGNSMPTIHNVVIRNNQYDPIAMSLLSDPIFTAITFDANGTRGIFILEGDLSSNATLRKRDIAGITNVAYIVRNLTVKPSATLTLEPGVVIKFSEYYYGISVEGGLVAVGTPAQKIIFTSLKDDSKGGDTNNDGSTSSPGKGNWNSVDFQNSSKDSVNWLKYCEFRYAGGYQWYNNEYGAVRIYSARVVIDSCVFTLSSSSGIGVFGSANPEINGNEITNVDLTPVTMSMFSSPTFADNVFFNVGYRALGIVGENYSQNATVPLRSFGGISRITYKLWARLTVNSGTEIVIPAGATFADYGITVRGSLKVLGTAANKVVFTDSKDDAYTWPNDLNGDGNTTSPYIVGDSRIFFEDGSVDTACVVRNAIFRWSEYPIDLQQAAPTIDSCEFSKDRWGMRLNGVSNPTINTCTFKDLERAPLLMSLAASYIPLGTNVILGKTYRAIGIVNETLAADATLSKRTFAGVVNIPYLITDLTVGTSSVLTIDPGVVVKFMQYGGISVRKGFLALGKSHPDSTIVFTSIADDFYGGDTNADSNATKPADIAWNRINFEDLSLDPLCQISHAIIRYAGYYGGGAITMTNASPTITYSSLHNNYKGIVASGASNPVINYCDIYKNQSFGVENVNKTFDIDARWNWWGDNSGPTHSSNPGGKGASITDMVNYAGFLTSGASNPIAGDVSLNGSVQAFDASLILKWIVNPGANPLNSLQQMVADVSGTMGITAFDASLVLQYVVGIVDVFPLELILNGHTDFVPALAAKRGSAGSLILAGGAGERGKEFTVTLSGADMRDIRSAGIVIKYNKDAVAPVGVSAGSVTGNALIESAWSDGELKITAASAAAFESSGELVQIHFTASRDIRGEVTAPISVKSLMLNEFDATAQVQNALGKIVGKPTTYSLEQNYPNPFNPSTVIEYQVPNDGEMVTLQIFDLAGRHVRTLVNEPKEAGTYKILWDGADASGRRAASGMYLYRMKSGSFVSVKKMIMIK